jgi:hypothetical protein
MTQINNTTFAELSSALAGGLVFGDANGVNAGYNAGRNAVSRIFFKII